METITLTRDASTQTPANFYRQGEIERDDTLRRIKFRMDCEQSWSQMSGSLLIWHKFSLQLYDATAKKLTPDFLESSQKWSERQYFVDMCFLSEVRSGKLEVIQAYFEDVERFYDDLQRLLPEEQRALQKTRMRPIVSLSAADREGKNALHLAVERGDDAIFDYVCDHFEARGWLNFTDGQGRTAAMIALELDYFYAFLRLAKYPLCANKQDHLGRTLLHVVASKPFAIYQKNPTVLWRVQSFQGLENIRDYWDRTPLHLAIERGNVDVASMCVFKTDLRLRDRQGCTPLHYIIQNPDLSLETKIKLINALNPSREVCQIVDYTGKTAIEYIPIIWKNADLLALFGVTRAHMMACLDDMMTILSVGFQPGDMSRKDYLDRTPLHVAATQNAMGVCAVVRRANVNVQDFRGNTAAHVALLSHLPGREKYDIIVALSQTVLEADLKVRNASGQSVIDCVPFDREHLSVLKYFHARGVFNQYQAARFQELERSVRDSYADGVSSSSSSS